ncbi:MAG: prepilin-type N-terminal cleavage/methylation domain-containing protein [Meiothermus sp.]|nr:prepilin-type N-terminal cleavage/methylation domain-containing protein [Meiothermus sp.]
MKNQGLSLIEFLISLAIFAVVMLAVLGLLTSGFKTGRHALGMQRAVSTARAEVERLRSNPLALPESCTNTSQNGYTVNCTPTPCIMQPSGLLCAATVHDPSAYQIRLELQREGQQMLQVLTVVAQ